MNPYTDALTAINDAVLPPTILRLATRLLSLVHEDNGYISVSWPEMMTICGVRNRGSVWKYLGALKAQGIIHYSTNERVDVSFEAWRTRPNERVDAPILTPPTTKHAPKLARPRASLNTTKTPHAETGASTRSNWRVDAPVWTHQLVGWLV